MSLITIPFKLLQPSPLNPRKHFDPDALADMAESIAAKGVLQNIVVREGCNTTGPGTWEIVAGERRWRAVRLLVETGRADEDFPLPARVIACDDAELLRLATAENVSRSSMTPLEEAHAFRSLTEAGDSTESIAALVGKTQRFVQLRLSLAQKASLPVQQALADGVISVKQAEAFAAAPAERQGEVLAKLLDGWEMTTVAAVKRALTRGTFAAAHALFAIAEYDGETIRDDDTGEVYLTDVAQVHRLQMARVKRLSDSLRNDERAAWVKIFAYDKGQYFHSWEYATHPGHPKAGAAIVIDSQWRVEVHRGVVAMADMEPAPKPADKPATKPVSDEPAEPTKAHLVACRQQRGLMLQDAVADCPPAAIRLAILGLLGATQVAIAGHTKEADDRVISPGLLQHLQTWADRYPSIMTLTKADASPTSAYSSGPLQLARPGYSPAGGQIQATAWDALAALPDIEVNALFAALVAERFGSFIGFGGGEYGDQSLPAAVAKDLNLPADHLPRWRPDEAFLKTLRKSQLVRLAEAVDVMTTPGVPRRAVLQATKTADLIADILGAWTENHSAADVLPTMRFGDPADVAAAVQDWLTGDKTPPKAKTKTTRKKDAA